MRDGVAGRFILVSFLFLAELILSFLWLKADLNAANQAAAFLKLLALNLLTGAAVAALLFGLLRRWHTAAARLVKFVTALPASEVSLPENGPVELTGLARAMKSMADRVRLVVDRAKLELSRRETILTCMAEGVLTVDNNLRVIFCNEAFATAFGTRMPVVEGRILYEVVREPIIREILERAVRGGPPETDRLQLPSAAGRWFEARALPLGEQPQRGAVIVLHDVTEIERQAQARKDFVADVSHELRTPLAAISGYAETLLDGALEDPENNRRFIEIIQSHAIRLNNIASDLLVISELDSDVPPATPPERIALLSVIESAVRTVEANAAMRDIHLDTARCRDCAVVGHRFRLEQALTNLLDNAVKFNKPEGEIAVECEPTAEDTVSISISDTGIGIPSEDLRLIFERFYRVDKARARPAGGTGLGLPIVKEVVERMGGTVSVESQLGRGSKFTIVLKAA